MILLKILSYGMLSSRTCQNCTTRSKTCLVD
jgi:hypothetical protein